MRRDNSVKENRKVSEEILKEIKKRLKDGDVLSMPEGSVKRRQRRR